MDYFNTVDEALQNATENSNKLMSIALGNANDKKEDQKEEGLNKALIVEGFRPIVTPDKQIQWVPKPHKPTDKLQSFQKAASSMSPELLQQTYPFLQYAEKHFLPVVDQLIDGLQNQTFSLQYFQEQLLALAKGGLQEAIKNTGGHAAQGKGSIADSTSAKQSAEIILKEKKAYEQLTSLSSYAQNGYANTSGSK